MSEAAAVAPAGGEGSVAPAVGGEGNVAVSNAPVGSSEGVAPAAAPAPAAAAPIESTPAVAPTPWTESLSVEQKDYVTNKGFTDPASVLESYVNLEKLRGVPQDRLLKLPEAADSPEWGDVYSKLGKPPSPEGYEFKVEPGEDTSFVDWARESFHKLNLTVDQGQALMESLNGYAENQQAGNADVYNQEIATQEMSLKKDWGSAYHQNIAIAQKAAKTFGFPSEAIDAMENAVGFDGVMKLMNGLGTRLGEADYVSGQASGGFGESAVLTPDQARGKLENLKKDPEFTAKYLAGDPDTKAKMSRLHQMAYPQD